MRCNIILSLIFLTALGVKDAVCQDSLFSFYRKLPYPVNYFAVNISGELFTIDKSNLLKKYNTNGDSVGVFNDVKRYGKLSYVEVQNPWKVILFYKNFQTIVLLDKYLKKMGSINLSDKNIFNVKAVTTSYDNNIWLFDGREFKIKKLDDNGNTLMASTDFRQLFDDVPVPEWIGDRDGLLYLYDPLKGFYVFDYYGAFKMLLPFKNWRSVNIVKNKELIGFDNQYLYSYTPPVPLATERKLPVKLTGSDNIRISLKEVYVLKNNELTIYKMK